MGAAIYLNPDFSPDYDAIGIKPVDDKVKGGGNNYTWGSAQLPKVGPTSTFELNN